MMSARKYYEGQLVQWTHVCDGEPLKYIAIITHTYPNLPDFPWDYHITYFDSDECEYQCYGCKEDELDALLLTNERPIIFGKIADIARIRLALLSNLMLPQNAAKFVISGWLDLFGNYPCYGLLSPFPDDHNYWVFAGTQHEAEIVAKCLTHHIITEGYKRAELAGKDFE